jgi:hypothetical protein
MIDMFQVCDECAVAGACIAVKLKARVRMQRNHRK